jgi:centrin-1
MISDIDKDGSGTIDFEEFLDMMKKKMLQEKNVEEEIEKAFTFFDDTGDGYIDFEKLKKVSQELGEICDDKILRDMIFAADLNEDGKVDKEEFMRVMRKMKLI